MESVVRKCLNIREKCFEINNCPIWLLSILPARIKSVESIVDNDNEQQSKIILDLSPFKFNSSIPLLNEQKLKNDYFENLNFEYPNDFSFENQLFNNYSQLIYSPSNQQLFYLFKKLKEFQQEKSNNLFLKKKNKKNKCKKMNCLNDSIPLTLFCKIHLLENDEKQVLFVKCNHCQQISIQQDNKNILHFCSYLN